MRNDIAGKRISCKRRKLQAKLATVKIGPLAEARASGPEEMAAISQPNREQRVGVKLAHCKNTWDRKYFACYDAGTVAVNTSGAEAV